MIWLNACKQMPKDKIRKVMNFLRYYIHFENPEMIAEFEQKINILGNNPLLWTRDRFNTC